MRTKLPDDLERALSSTGSHVSGVAPSSVTARERRVGIEHHAHAIDPAREHEIPDVAAVNGQQIDHCGEAEVDGGVEWRVAPLRLPRIDFGAALDEKRCDIARIGPLRRAMACGWRPRLRSACPDRAGKRRHQDG